MKDVKIKICGVKTAQIAQNCIDEGADYIGLVFYAGSSRNVSLRDASVICHLTQATSTLPVAVFVDASLDQINEICEGLCINHVQLHSDHYHDSVQSLNSTLNIIHACTFGANKIAYPPLRSSHDFLLIDSDKAGSGERWEWSVFEQPPTQRFFLAGGLNNGNVKTAIGIVRPYGVDVSSGVESSPGHKCDQKIKQFIRTVREGSYV